MRSSALHTPCSVITTNFAKMPETDYHKDVGKPYRESEAESILEAIEVGSSHDGDGEKVEQSDPEAALHQSSKAQEPQLTKVKTVQDWDGPDDPGNPINVCTPFTDAILLLMYGCRTVGLREESIALLACGSAWLLDDNGLVSDYSSEPRSARLLWNHENNGYLTTHTLRDWPRTRADHRCTAVRTIRTIYSLQSLDTGFHPVPTRLRSLEVLRQSVCLQTTCRHCWSTGLGSRQRHQR